MSVALDPKQDDPSHSHQAPHEHPSQQPTLLRVRDLECGYNKRTIVGPLSFHLHESTFMLIEGGNGVGKSTLIKTLIGLLPPVSGSCEWEVAPQKLRFVPQTRTLDPMLPATVFDVLSTGLHRGSGLGSLRINIDRDQLTKVLQTVDMEDFANHLFRELSEGQKQLILLARALLGEPRVLILDEPAASMDPVHEAETIDLLHEIQVTSGVTIMMIAHGSPPARRASTRIMTVERGGSIHIEECGDDCADIPPSQLSKD